MLSVNNLEVVYNDVILTLRGLSIEVPQGSIVALLGANGAGKTTTLRSISGLLDVHDGEVTKGQVTWNEDRIDDRNAADIVNLGVVQVLEGRRIFAELTVDENLSFWGRAAQVPTAEIAAAARRLAIEPRLGSVPIRKLSAGQRRRVSMAVAAAKRPELWLLDEPHAGLDQAGRDIVDELIADAIAAGASVLVASHELDRVRPVVTRQVTIAGGMVIDSPARSATERSANAQSVDASAGDGGSGRVG